VSGTGTQLEPLAIAFVLSAVIGVEREMRHKVAGLRTHALVGMGSAVFMLVSKYGFDDVLDPGRVVLNPGQLAGQIVTGIGFLGGGIIWVRRGNARGLITAANIWVVAAVGMAAGAGLYTLAIAATIGDLLVTVVFTPVTDWLRRGQGVAGELSLTYRQGTGVLREALAELTRNGCAVEGLSVAPNTSPGDDVCVTLEVRGSARMTDLTTALAQIDGVVVARGSAARDGTGP
jgi:putative Mg2+ transporter-C (MgtC) family protein